MTASLKHGPWRLSDLDSVPKNGLKVFSCFHGAGGSTMGYKLAGYEVLGGVEIDKEMMAVYRENHKPKLSYLMGVQEFKTLSDLPDELYNLDILDGSPPCSSFSMAGSREKAWGDKKKFREGQKEQVLDTLFFDFIEIAGKLRPKVVVAENVKGLIAGNAKGYVKEIFQKFKEAGYSVQLFLLNAAAMGVPQKRERTFFIANRLNKNIKLSFQEKPSTIGEALAGIDVGPVKPITTEQRELWQKTVPGYSFSSAHPKGHWFNSFRASSKGICPTIVASTGAAGVYHWTEPRKLSDNEYKVLQTFPRDFNPISTDIKYLIGMSVPPFMMQRVALEIERQLLGGTQLGD